MQRFTDAITSARRLIRRSPEVEDRRQAFEQAFGQFPPHHEATVAERGEYMKTVVHPLLVQRATEIGQAENSAQAKAAFDSAYEAAAALKLTDKGKTYKDYLPGDGKSYQDFFSGQKQGQP